VAQEAISNIVKHSQAREARLELTGTSDHLELLVRDDGKGFEYDAERERGLGLLSMRERLRLVGGTLRIQTGSSGDGNSGASSSEVNAQGRSPPQRSQRSSDRLDLVKCPCYFPRLLLRFGGCKPLLWFRAPLLVLGGSFSEAAGHIFSRPGLTLDSLGARTSPE